MGEGQEKQIQEQTSFLGERIQHVQSFHYSIPSMWFVNLPIDCKRKELTTCRGHLSALNTQPKICMSSFTFTLWKDLSMQTLDQ